MKTFFFAFFWDIIRQSFIRRVPCSWCWRSRVTTTFISKKILASWQRGARKFLSQRKRKKSWLTEKSACEEKKPGNFLLVSVSSLKRKKSEKFSFSWQCLVRKFSWLDDTMVASWYRNVVQDTRRHESLRRKYFAAWWKILAKFLWLFEKLKNNRKNFFWTSTAEKIVKKLS